MCAARAKSESETPRSTERKGGAQIRAFKAGQLAAQGVTNAEAARKLSVKVATLTHYATDFPDEWSDGYAKGMQEWDLRLLPKAMREQEAALDAHLDPEAYSATVKRGVAADVREASGKALDRLTRHKETLTVIVQNELRPKLEQIIAAASRRLPPEERESFEQECAGILYRSAPA